MNYKQIVVKQLNVEAADLRTKLAGVEAAITALGGTISGGTRKALARRSRGRGAGRPRAASKPAKSAAVEALSPALAAQLVAIKNNASLSPIQKAQASRKARLAARAAAPAPQGAVLSEATAG